MFKAKITPVLFDLILSKDLLKNNIQMSRSPGHIIMIKLQYAGKNSFSPVLLMSDNIKPSAEDVFIDTRHS